MCVLAAENVMVEVEAAQDTSVEVVLMEDGVEEMAGVEGVTVEEEAEEVVLETEITNKPALRLYEALGFVRDKRLFRYYLNGVDASRLKLWLR